MFKNKQIVGWALYDWANSAFATTVMAGFFPVFFKQFWSAGADINKSTFYLGLTNSVASLLVAVSAPILGAIADQGSSRKKFVIFFAYLGVLMTCTLFFLGQGEWILASIIYAAGVIGFSGSIVFYDSLLPLVSDEERRDYISALGYALGYLGGGLLFTVNVLMTQKPQWFGFNNSADGVRYSFITVGLWWAVFTVPLIVWVREEKTGKMIERNTIITGFRKLSHTIRKIRSLRHTFLFLGAYWLYIDGVDTIIRMAVDFGLSIGFDAGDLILALLIVQFVGFPSALLFGKLGEKWNVKKSIYLGIFVYIIVTVFGTFMTHKNHFYILAVMIGLVQGGVQALSRSFYSRLIPAGYEAEFFGFYNMLGKFAAIIGPLLIGGTGLMVRNMGYGQTVSSRAGMASLILLFISGAWVLSKVSETRGKVDAQTF